MNIKPIRTKKDYKAAIRRIESLWDANPRTSAADELDILSSLVHIYEEEHFYIPEPNPIEAIKFRMEQLGLKKTDIAPYFGGANRVTEVFKGQRNLTVKMIRSLHQTLNIPAESLIG